MKETKEFIKNIVEGKNGFSLGEPWKFSKDTIGAIIPILRVSASQRDYTTFSEAEKDLIFKDTGSISPITLTSESKRPIFIRSGTVLEGISGQDRAVQHSMIIQPNKELDIEVKCVHASRPTSHGGSFKYAGYAPREVQRNLRRGQSATWNSVNSYFCSMSVKGVHMSEEARPMGHTIGSVRGSVRDVQSDNLPKIKKLQQKMDKNLQSILKEVPVLENQIGAIIVGMKGVVGLESFDHPKSWKAQYKEVIEQYSDELAKESPSKLFTFDETKIMEAIKSFLKQVQNAQVSIIDENTFTFKIKGYLGEGVTHNSHIVHLFVMEDDQDDNQDNDKFDRPIGGLAFTSRTRPIRPTFAPPKTMESILKKGQSKVLQTLDQKGQATWSELKQDSNVCEATLSKRLKEAKASNLVGEAIRHKNGKKVYYRKY